VEEHRSGSSWKPYSMTRRSLMADPVAESDHMSCMPVGEACPGQHQLRDGVYKSLTRARCKNMGLRDTRAYRAVIVHPKKRRHRPGPGLVTRSVPMQTRRIPQRRRWTDLDEVFVQDQDTGAIEWHSTRNPTSCSRLSGRAPSAVEFLDGGPAPVLPNHGWAHWKISRHGCHGILGASAFGSAPGGLSMIEPEGGLFRPTCRQNDAPQ